MADMPAIIELTRKHGLAVVEDAAQAIDAALEGKKAGTWGNLATFSFQSNKTITAGEGGLIMTNDPDLADKVTALRAFGRVQGKSAERSSALSSVLLSSNYRLSELQSAVLLAQMDRYPEQDNLRQANAVRLTEGLRAIRGVQHVWANTASMKHAYYYYLVRYEPEAFGNLSPEALCKALNAEGIPFVPGDRKPIYNHPVFESRNLAGTICDEVLERYRRAVDIENPGCPQTEDACGCTLILRHQVLLGAPGDMDDVVESVAKVKANMDELGLKEEQ
jgi:dTDP-4-amino-4,6-dideoxygalactose transaminase